MHLLRETLSAFATKLDPNTFVRVHRSRLVRIGKVAAITPLTNGDGLLRLIDGLSRGYRNLVHQRLTASP